MTNRRYLIALTMTAAILGAFATAACLPASAMAHMSDVGIMVSPTQINSTIAVGDETTETVTLENSSAAEVVINSHAGTLPANGAPPTISIDPEQVTLKPGESAKVNVRIDVPDEAEAGHRIQSILFDTAVTQERDVSIVGQVSVLVGLTIIHPVSDVNWSFPRLIDSTDQACFQMEGKNTGNFTTRLTGDVQLDGLLSGDQELSATSEPVAVGETGSVQVLWDDTPLFALKRATFDLSSGIGAPVEKKAFLIVFPWKLVSMVVVIGAIAGLGFRLEPSLAKVLSAKRRRTD